MTHSGFEAAPADFAAAAPRFAEAADGLSAALARTVNELEGQGPFWGRDEDFEHEYLGDWRGTADLAAACAQVLRAVAAQLGGMANSYQNTDSMVAQDFRVLGGASAAGGRG